MPEPEPGVSGGEGATDGDLATKEEVPPCGVDGGAAGAPADADPEAAVAPGDPFLEEAMISEEATILLHLSR